MPVTPDQLSGYINLLKPPGMTSNDAVQCIKHALPFPAKDITIGHAGTLDPEAAGVLPIMLGKGTRMFDMLCSKQKTYIAECVFGCSTDTQDDSGHIINRTDHIDRDGIYHLTDEILPRFIGRIMQIPPSYSAIKRGGVPMYERARAGDVVTLEPRDVVVDDITWLGETPRGRLMKVDCHKGTYIRTLCHDIGRAVGCPAHMGFLVRASAGGFSIDNSYTIEDVLAAIDEDRVELPCFSAMLAPLDTPAMHLPRLDIDYLPGMKTIRNGVPLRRMFMIDKQLASGTYRLYMDNIYWGVAVLDDEALKLAVRMVTT